MADKIQSAYESSKNIYDDVLTQGNFFSRMYIKIFWSGTDDNEIARKGKSRRADWLVKNILAKRGWFSPPFQTEEELRGILQKMYK